MRSKYPSNGALGHKEGSIQGVIGGYIGTMYGYIGPQITGFSAPHTTHSLVGLSVFGWVLGPLGKGR